jgi:predicted secreted protein
MTVLNGVVLYLLIWWTALFVVLPFGVRPIEDADPTSGWRGVPARPHLLSKALATTALAAVIWLACYFIVQSGWISFRSSWLAIPET